MLRLLRGTGVTGLSAMSELSAFAPAQLWRPLLGTPREAIRTYAKDRLSPYKVPKSIEIVDAIPRSAATKVNRGALLEARGG